MKRDIYNDLLAWKSSSQRKPLLVRGARQVGKTYILQEFGGRDYDRIAYFDLERDPDVRAFFSNSLDPEKIIRNLSLYQGWTIEPARHQAIPTPVFPRGQGELPRHVPAHLP
jgi:hypothetical protein